MHIKIQYLILNMK